MVDNGNQSGSPDAPWIRATKGASKTLARGIGSLALVPGFRAALPAFSDYMHLVMGQGAAAGWDLASEVAVAARAVARMDPFVIDAGANTGAWTREFLRHKPAARILAIEPLAVAADALRLISPGRIEVLEAALSACDGEAMLHRAHPTDVAASLTPRRDPPFVRRDFRATKVRTLALDHLDSLPERIDFLKLDLEGHDLDALRGAGHLLETGRIGALSFEFGSANLNSRTYFLDFWELLVPLGFRVSRIGPGGFLWPVDCYCEALEYFRGATNYLAVSALHRSVAKSA
jgi:FkbM family methyltransferase